MNQISDLATVNIADLVKASKQVQNRVRQDIQALNCSHGKFGEREDLPPIWDTVSLDPYVKKVVADYMDSSPRTQRPSRTEITSRTEPEMFRKGRDFLVEQPYRDTFSFPRSQVKKIVEHLESYSTQLSQPKLWTAENVIRQPETPTTVSMNKNVKTQRCAKTYSKQTPAKQPKKRKLPLQRFAGSSLERIDFSKEHPNLELCASHSTVFPRRFHKSLGEDSTQRNLSHKKWVNLAAAKMREPDITTPEIAIPILLKVLKQNETFKKKAVQPAEKKTWKQVFKNNKSNEKTTTDATKARPKKSAVVDGKRGIDIICTPYKGLYHLEKEGALLSRQQMCTLKRLPVMYIRPECRVQRVAKISIHNNNGVDQEQRTLEMVPSNVGYLECRHEDGATKATHGHNKNGEDSPHEEVSSSPKIAVPTRRPGVPTVKSTNKFIDAIGSTEVKSRKSYSSLQSDKMSVLSTVVNSTMIVSSSVQSDKMSASSTVVNSTTGASAIEAVENNFQNNVKEIFNRTTQPNKNLVPTSDVYVQTDFYKTQSESPLVDPTPSMSSQIASLILSEEITDRTADTDESVLSAECGLDDRMSSSVAMTEQSQTRHNQTFSVGKAPGVSHDFEKLNPYSSEADTSERGLRVRQRRRKKPLPRVELVLDDNTCEESDRCEYVQSAKTMSIPANGTPPNHSMETEIKRAVKIFLSSLTPENGDFYTGNERCVRKVQHILKLSRPPRTIHRTGVLREYDSSSSGEESGEGLDKSHPFDELTSFSMSSSLSSEVESDSTRRGNISTRSQKNRSDSLSEGEVLSVGEV